MFRRTAVAVGLGVLLLGLLSACSSASDPDAPGGPPAGSGSGSGSPSIAPPPGLSSPAAKAVVGTWRPLEIQSYTLPDAYPDGFATATITFNGQGGWMGSDGCNRLSGTYTIAPDGALNATSGPSTLIGCANVPNSIVLEAASSVRVEGEQLSLLDLKGDVMARYQRVGLSNQPVPAT